MKNAKKPLKKRFSTDKNRKVIYVACEKYFWKEINVFVKSGISFSREL